MTTQKLTGKALCIEYLRYHGGDMEREAAEREAAISLLIHGIDKRMSDSACDTILNAVHYLRSGNYRFDRKRHAA
jgi:hypothetical protein